MFLCSCFCESASFKIVRRLISEVSNGFEEVFNVFFWGVDYDFVIEIYDVFFVFSFGDCFVYFFCDEIL